MLNEHNNMKLGTRFFFIAFAKKKRNISSDTQQEDTILSFSDIKIKKFCINYRSITAAVLGEQNCYSLQIIRVHCRKSKS